MDRAILPLPEEPTTLRAAMRSLLENDPDAGLRLIEEGGWIVGLLWEEWQAALEARGLDRQRFLSIIAGYQNELRLWVMGERTWEHCIEGLTGRITRRLPAVGNLRQTEPKERPA